MPNLIRRNQEDRNPRTTQTATPTSPWDPFRVMDALLGWDGSRDALWAGQPRGFSASFEVKELKDAYVINADLPGINENDVDVTVTGNVLTVSGKREAEREDGDHRYHAMERSFGAFTRSFSLPDGVNVDDLTANLKNGVLTLHIPKRPEVQPRKINLGKRGGEGQQGTT
jgi:HSP20 family protein